MPSKVTFTLAKAGQDPQETTLVLSDGVDPETVASDLKNRGKLSSAFAESGFMVDPESVNATPITQDEASELFKGSKGRRL